jgi:hypothetical protein
LVLGRQGRKKQKGATAERTKGRKEGQKGEGQKGATQRRKRRKKGRKGPPNAERGRKEGRKEPPNYERKGKERGHPTIKWIDAHFLVQIDDQLIDRAKNRGCARRVRAEIAESARQRS